MNGMSINSGSAWYMLESSLYDLESIRPVARLQSIVGSTAMDDDEPTALPDDGANLTGTGVAIISVRGPMMRSPSYAARRYGGFVGYEDISQSAEDLRNDPTVSAVVLSLDTPGGTVNGIEEATNAIAALAAEKPVVAHTSGLMCSGGVYLSTAATERYATRDATIGSIGVVCSVVDISRMLANAGVSIVHIAEPPGKASLRVGQTVTPEATADLREGVREDYQTFRDRVASATGLTNDQIDAMDARVYSGAGAKRAGLIHGVGSLQQAIDRAASLSSVATVTKTRTTSMPVTTKTAATVTTTDGTKAVESKGQGDATATAIADTNPIVPKTPAPPAHATLAEIDAAIPADLPGRDSLVLSCLKDGATVGEAGVRVVKAYAEMCKAKDTANATLQAEAVTLRDTIAKAQKAGTIAFNPNALPNARGDETVAGGKDANASAFQGMVIDYMDKTGESRPKAIQVVGKSHSQLYEDWNSPSGRKYPIPAKSPRK